MSSATSTLSSGFESLSDPRADGRFAARVNDENSQSPIVVTRTHIGNVKPATRVARSTNMNWQSIVEWYRILRVHYHWPVFEAIRYALWLSR